MDTQIWLIWRVITLVCLLGTLVFPFADAGFAESKIVSGFTFITRGLVFIRAPVFLLYFGPVLLGMVCIIFAIAVHTIRLLSGTVIVATPPMAIFTLIGFVLLLLFIAITSGLNGLFSYVAWGYFLALAGLLSSGIGEILLWILRR